MAQLLPYRDVEYRRLPSFPRNLKVYYPGWAKKWILEMNINYKFI